jgi:hypothetical protein
VQRAKRRTSRLPQFADQADAIELGDANTNVAPVGATPTMIIEK